MLVNMAFMIPSVLIVTLAPNKVALLMGQLLCGFPWGVFAALAPAYSSEVCPVGLRAYLTTYVNMCWVSRGARTLSIIDKDRLEY